MEAGAESAVPPRPVEYAVAVDWYLAGAPLADSSRRVYRIALTTWSWALVGRPIPVGVERRRTPPPIVPLAALDDPGTAARLRLAFEQRRTEVGARTANRELSALRSAVDWWRDRGWLHTGPDVRLLPRPPAEDSRRGAPFTAETARAVLALRVPLRDKALWHLLYESAAPMERLLALNVSDLDLPQRRTRAAAERTAGPVRWREGAARVLPLLVAGRATGPLFLTDRRAPAGSPAADVCPYTGRARLSYRRAVELLAAATRPLDPAGRGFTPNQLRRAGAQTPRPRRSDPSR